MRRSRNFARRLLTGGADTGPVDRLAAATKIEEKLTERFKSDNALLRNSLSYVGLLSTSPGLQRTESSARQARWSAGHGHSPTHSRFLGALPDRLSWSAFLSLRCRPGRGGPGNRSGAHISRSPPKELFFPQSTTLSGGCSPFRPGRLEETRAQFVRSSHGLGILGATVSPAPLCDVRSACARAHRSRKAAQGPGGGAAKAGGVRASDRRAVRAPDQLPAW